MSATNLSPGGPGPDDTQMRASYRVTGMDCGACVTKVETAVNRVKGVESATAVLGTGRLTVAHDDRLVSEDLLKQVRNLGYGISESAPEDAAETPFFAAPEAPWWASVKARFALAYAVALGAAAAGGRLLPIPGEWLVMAALLVGLVPIARRAMAAARAGSPFSIEMLMTIAAAGAALIGAAGEAAMVVLLFLIGEMLEGAAASRARRNIRGLARLVPDTALVEKEDGIAAVSIGELPVGALVQVRPGDRVPADGTIVSGTSELDEASITGESVPVAKSAGDEVFAGTVNANGNLRVRVTARAADNTIARIIRLVEDAQSAKAPTQRFIDRFSRYYTPGVLAVAAFTAIGPPLVMGGGWGEWVYKALALLLIGCPCALVISTPAAIAAGLSAGARQGLLIKGGAVLERLRDLTAVAFDKTGTITRGAPEVTDLVAISRSERDVLSLAGALEQGASHPLASAILRKARAAGASVPPAFDASAVPGAGVTGSVGPETVFLGSPEAAARHADLAAAQAHIARLTEAGQTVVVVVAGGTVAGLIALRDAVRPEAGAGIAALKARGVRAVMLTGDNARLANAVAGEVGIEARAGLLPQDKQAIIAELQAGGEVVAKVGDGINDAPALAAADVGIAMGSGTDIALDTGDAAILHGRLGDIADMMQLSGKVLRNIYQNIAIALGLKAVFLVTTLAGITGLWPAILADTGATVLVTANAMRLLAWRPEKLKKAAAPSRSRPSNMFGAAGPA